MRPNILLIVLDTARADALEPYGGPEGSTPAVDDLARSGLAVANAYAPSCWTLPSHVGMFTGMLARALGLGQQPPDGYSGIQRRMRSLDDVLLPSVLRRSGYTTVGASCNAWINPATGFDTGFDDFAYVASPRGRSFNEPGLRGAARWLWAGMQADLDDGAGAVEDRLRTWLAAWDGDRPFFWFVNLTECHTPYLPPHPYNDLSLPGRLMATVDVKRYQTLEAIWRHCAGEFAIPDGAIARMRHLYHRAIRSLDDWVARALDLLDRRGVLHDTIVIVTSDHGENFGEGGRYGHCFSLDQRLIRVPFVVAGPIGHPPGTLSLLDVPALLAEAVGIDDHPWRPPDGDQHVAVSQLDPLAPPDDPRVDQVREEWGLDDDGIRLMTEPMTCATDGRWKVVLHGDEERVYDLVRDPLELEPIAAGDEVAPLRAALREEEVWATPDAGDGSGPAIDRRPPEGDEVAELEEQMRLLGYL